jgi:hypothetical protein
MTHTVQRVTGSHTGLKRYCNHNIKHSHARTRTALGYHLKRYCNHNIKHSHARTHTALGYHLKRHCNHNIKHSHARTHTAQATTSGVHLGLTSGCYCYIVRLSLFLKKHGRSTHTASTMNPTIGWWYSRRPAMSDAARWTPSKYTRVSFNSVCRTYTVNTDSTRQHRKAVRHKLQDPPRSCAARSPWCSPPKRSAYLARLGQLSRGACG